MYPLHNYWQHSSAQNSLLEIQSIELRVKPFVKTLLSNVYCLSSRGANNGNDFDMSELPHDRNSITGGDLNVQSQMWDIWQPEDYLGSNLEEWMMEKDFCMNDGAATRTNPGTGGSSAPDVTLVHISLLDRVEWSTTECLGSDHLPILITVDCQVTTLNAPSLTELKWNWKSANFRLFADSVEKAVTAAPVAIHESSLDSRSKFLNMGMIDAANKQFEKSNAVLMGRSGCIGTYERL